MLLKRICPECEKEFEKESWNILKYEKKGAKVCCSRSCAASRVNRNRNPKRLLKCVNCEKEQLVNKSDRREKYCSRKCYKEDQKDRLAEQCRKIGKECADKISKTQKQRFKDDPTCHGFYGKNHSRKTKEKISKFKKKYYETHDGYWKDKKLSEDVKKKMSETRTKKWINGEYDHIKMAWAKGKYYFKKAKKKVFYRSSWELKYMKYLDGRDDIDKCSYESLRIPYYDSAGKNRYYIPDFFIEYTDNKKEIIEIKPYSRKSSEINKRKTKAAKEYCKQRNIKYRVLSERYLKYIGIV